MSLEPGVISSEIEERMKQLTSSDHTTSLYKDLLEVMNMLNQNRRGDDPTEKGFELVNAAIQRLREAQEFIKKGNMGDDTTEAHPLGGWPIASGNMHQNRVLDAILKQLGTTQTIESLSKAGLSNKKPFNKIPTKYPGMTMWVRGNGITDTFLGVAFDAQSKGAIAMAPQLPLGLPVEVGHPSAAQMRTPVGMKAH